MISKAFKNLQLKKRPWGEGRRPKTHLALSFPRDLECLKLTLIPSVLGRMLVFTRVDFLLVIYRCSLTLLRGYMLRSILNFGYFQALPRNPWIKGYVQPFPFALNFLRASTYTELSVASPSSTAAGYSKTSILRHTPTNYQREMLIIRGTRRRQARR